MSLLVSVGDQQLNKITKNGFEGRLIACPFKRTHNGTIFPDVALSQTRDPLLQVYSNFIAHRRSLALTYRKMPHADWSTKVCIVTLNQHSGITVLAAMGKQAPPASDCYVMTSKIQSEDALENCPFCGISHAEK